MPSGHFERTKEYARKISEGMKTPWHEASDTTHTIGEICNGRHLGKGHCQYTWDECPNCKKQNWRRSDSVGHPCAKCSQYLVNQRPEVNKKKSDSLKGYREFRFRNYGNRGRKPGFTCTPEHIEKVRQAAKERWQVPEKRDRMIKAFLDMRSPNQHEIVIQEILDKLYPNEWKFVGNGMVIINGLNPDFVNINGKKMIIEYFGRPWHKPQDEKFKIKMYAEFGWKTLIIWSDEFGSRVKEEVIKEKVDEFYASY